MIVNKNEIENWKKDIIVIKLNNTQMYDTTTHTHTIMIMMIIIIMMTQLPMITLTHTHRLN